MRASLLAAVAFATLASTAYADPITYAGPSATNIDSGLEQDYSFTVDAPGNIGSLAVSIDVGTPYADDVTFSLSHLGTTVVFYNGYGDTGDSTIIATFSDTATTSAPYDGTTDGTFLPASPLAVFDGLAVAGTYTLSTIDHVVPGDGTPLLSSSITINAVPEPGTVGLMLVGLLGLGMLRRNARI